MSAVVPLLCSAGGAGACVGEGELAKILRDANLSVVCVGFAERDLISGNNELELGSGSEEGLAAGRLSFRFGRNHDEPPFSFSFSLSL